MKLRKVSLALIVGAALAGCANLDERGNEIVTGAPEDFAALIRADLQSYARLVKEANIPAQ